MKDTIIYIELLEGARVFAPVHALHLGKSYYKVLEYNRKDYDDLRFKIGAYVFCPLTKFSNNENLVPLAYCEVSKEEAEYISANSSKD